MPEGDSLHRAARRLQALVGERVEVESPHPQAAVKRLPERLSGRRLESVEAVGKNLLLRFEGGLVLRSHLRMRGRWQLRARNGGRRVGRPWLVLRGGEQEAVLWNGPVLELHGRGVRLLGPDVLAEPPNFDAMLVRLRETDQGRELGDALLDQRLVAGIGNAWKAEALWRARLSPWRRLGDLTDAELQSVLGEAAELMRASVEGHRVPKATYRKAGRPCPRCGETIRSRGQGDDNRIAYWCPACQKGEPPPVP
jgi:endonuclease VIII